MAVLYGQARRYINGDSINASSYLYSCKFGLLKGGENMAWTKNNDEKLRLLDYYGVTVTDMAKILRVTYNLVNSRLGRLGIKASTQIPNEGTFSKERLAMPEIRENICLLYMVHLKEGDSVAYVAKACGFKRSQVESCLAECLADGTYGRVLQRVNNHSLKVGQI